MSRKVWMPMPDVKCVLIHDNFQNFKSYNIPKAQLVIADIPYNIGTDFYASRPDWYVDGDNKNGESSKARKAAFNTDFTFNIAEYFHFCNRLLKKEPGTGERNAPCMIVFCAFQQIPKVITEAEKPKTEKQIRKWLADPYSDAAEYKLWGNGVALPCVYFVLAGIAWCAGLEE